MLFRKNILININIMFRYSFLFFGQVVQILFYSHGTRSHEADF